MNLMAWLVVGLVVVFAALMLGFVVWTLVSSLVNTEGHIDLGAFGWLVAIVAIAILTFVFGDEGIQWLNTVVGTGIVAAVLVVILAGLIRASKRPWLKRR
jgi:hypothetical protein